LNYILNIETSTTNCSVALYGNSNFIDCIEENDENYSHSINLHVFINKLLSNCNIKPKDLSAIAVSKGPGSYTGLRIGVSTAKGLCYALNIPLISVDTLDAFALQINSKDGFIIPLLDARRMEVYSSVYDNQHNKVRKTDAEILDISSFKDFLKSNKVYFLGNANNKTNGIIKSDNAVFVDNKFPSAIEVGIIASQKFKINDFENVGEFEPFYLKDFIGTKLKSN
jgi:tRNA threonylcarbamoyladenosine biosynthesis protein TsaB